MEIDCQLNPWTVVCELGVVYTLQDILGEKQKEIKMEPFIFFHNYKLNL